MVRPAYGRFNDETNTPTEILASTVGLEKIGGMIDTAVSSKIVKGTVMARVTATGLWVPYSDAGEAGAAGTGVALGIISDDFDPTLSTDQNDIRLDANFYIHGSFVKANLTGLDANGETDLKGRTIGTVFTF